MPSKQNRLILCFFQISSYYSTFNTSEEHLRICSAALRFLLCAVAGKESLSHAAIPACCFGGLRNVSIVLGLRL